MHRHTATTPGCCSSRSPGQILNAAHCASTLHVRTAGGVEHVASGCGCGHASGAAGERVAPTGRSIGEEWFAATETRIKEFRALLDPKAARAAEAGRAFLDEADAREIHREAGIRLLDDSLERCHNAFKKALEDALAVVGEDRARDYASEQAVSALRAAHKMLHECAPRSVRDCANETFIRSMPYDEAEGWRPTYAMGDAAPAPQIRDAIRRAIDRFEPIAPKAAAPAEPGGAGRILMEASKRG